MRAQVVPSALLFVSFALSAPVLSAQFYPIHRPGPSGPVYDKYPIEVGGYFQFGAEQGANPAVAGAQPIGLIGLYADWKKHRLQPGLDLRVSGGYNSVHGTLVGPRLGIAAGPFHPYAEALFGPNEIYGSLGGSDVTRYRAGVTSAFVLGVDGDIGYHTRWRILEISKGTFSGLSGSSPFILSSGFTLHIP